MSTTRGCAGWQPRRRRWSTSQILVGATMRHTEAGLAIPDFPLMFGGLVPDHWDPKIAHPLRAPGRRARRRRASIVMTAAHVWSHHRRRRGLTRPAAAAGRLVAVQVTLGALTVLSAARRLDQQLRTSSAARWCWRRRWSSRCAAGGEVRETVRLTARRSAESDDDPSTLSSARRQPSSAGRRQPRPKVGSRTCELARPSKARARVDAAPARSSASGAGAPSARSRTTWRSPSHA